MTRTPEEKKKMCARVKRIEGQIKTLEKMIERDAPCVEVMRLIKGLLTKVVTDHLNGCISSVISKKDAALIDELSDFFKTLK